MADILGFPHGFNGNGQTADRPCDTEESIYHDATLKPLGVINDDCFEPAHRNPLPREEILNEAKRLICTDRHEEHGDAKQNLGLTAIFWSAWTGEEITAHDVAMMNALQKISRMIAGYKSRDNRLDAIGYIALAEELCPDLSKP